MSLLSGAMAGIGAAAATAVIALVASRAKSKEPQGSHFREGDEGARAFDSQTANQLLSSTLAAFTYDELDGNDPITGEPFDGIVLTTEATPDDPTAAEWALEQAADGLYVVAHESIVIPAEGGTPVLYAMTASQAERAATDPNSEMAILLEP